MNRTSESTPRPVRVLVEKTADKRFLEGMFRPKVNAGDIEIDTCVTGSEITGRAQRSLQEGREEPLVLVFNAKTQDPMVVEEEFRRPVQRMLSPTSADWHVTVAAPRLDSWALADRRILRAFNKAAAEHGQQTYRDRSVLFEELTRAKPFDADAAAKAFPEFRALAAFLDRHARPAKGAPMRPADAV